jgi:predicted dehydrogenase
MKAAFVDPANPFRKAMPETLTFPKLSTERAELEHFAQAALAGRALAVPGGDEVHNVAVLEAIMRSAREGRPVSVEQP